MIFKYLAGVVAVVLVVVYLIPPIWKLKDVELGAVVLIGITMMLVDLWQSLKSKDD